MIQENNLSFFAKKTKDSPLNLVSNSILIIMLSLGLSFNSQLPVLAKSSLTQISSIYFNSKNSIVLETSTLSKLESFVEYSNDNYVLTIPNAMLHGTIPKRIKSNDFEINLKTVKSSSRSRFLPNDMVQIEFRSLSNLQIIPELVSAFSGLAYQVNLLAQNELLVNVENIKSDSDDVEDIFHVAELAQVKDENLHRLTASLANRNLISFMKHKSVAEQFLEDLGEDFFKNEIFIEETFQKIDSVSLYHIGSELEKRGMDSDANRAYNEALEIDPDNINARLGIARTSSDQEVKVKNYLASLDNQALAEIGKSWYSKGIESNNLQLISQSLIPFQLAVLKNPDLPEPRFDYAQILEQTGPDFLYQASKRYLESAVLAKNKFLAGEEEYKSLLRKSTEALIRTLTVLGDQESALKYCNSYLGLGFSNFLDGRSISSIIKEIKFNRNPFFQS
jgi:tetratricopeptide (TPR) repeat protein